MRRTNVEYKIIDCDQHVIEPPNLWEKYLPQKFQDQAPKLVQDEEGAMPGSWARMWKPSALWRQ